MSAHSKIKDIHIQTENQKVNHTATQTSFIDSRRDAKEPSIKPNESRKSYKAAFPYKYVESAIWPKAKWSNNKYLPISANQMEWPNQGSMSTWTWTWTCKSWRTWT